MEVVKLFVRGNATSEDSNINGIIKFPNTPVINGIITKKIIKKACLVIVEL